MPSTRIVASLPRVIASKATGYFHFPDLVGFIGGALLATMTMQADALNIPAITSSVYSLTSASGAQTQQATSDIFFASAGEPTIAIGSTIVGWQYNPQPVPDNGTAVSTFQASRRTWSNGGSTYAIETNAVSISGFPSPIKPMAETAFRAWFFWFGKVITDGSGALLSTAYVTYDGAALATAVVLRSTDSGYTWTYRGEICAPADVPLSTEGCTETALLRLANNDILAVIRTPGGGNWRSKATSTDSGSTWSAPADFSFNPTGASSPSLLRLTSGKLVLAIGFGNDIYVAFSSDSGSTWPDIWHVNDLHNWQTSTPLVTTAYVPLVEVSPNRVALVYDEIPTGRASQPNDGSLGPNRLWLLDFSVAP